MDKKSFFRVLATSGFAGLTWRSEGDGLFDFTALGIKCLGGIYMNEKGTDVDNIQLYCGFIDNVPLEKFNIWNREWRYVKAYKATSGGIAIELDHFVGKDGSPATLPEVYEMWCFLLVRAAGHFSS
jgi:hypothetical protein